MTRLSLGVNDALSRPVPRFYRLPSLEVSKVSLRSSAIDDVAKKRQGLLEPLELDVPRPPNTTPKTPPAKVTTTTKSNELPTKSKYEAIIGLPTSSKTPIDSPTWLNAFYESDFESSASEDEVEDELSSSQKMYHKSCHNLGIISFPSVLEQLSVPNGELRLKHRLLSVKQVQSICVALMSMPDNSLTTLVLDDTGMTAKGLAKFAPVIIELACIVHLDLSNNNLGREGAELCGKIFLRNKTIVEFKASGCGFEDNDASCLCNNLEFDRTLTSLDLSHNNYREQAGFSLAEMLRKNRSLTSLDLKWNHLRRKGAVAVAASLKLNPNLTSLDVSFNGFGDMGAIELAKTLKTNKSLIAVDLNNNRITNTGAMQLGEALAKNKTLKALSVSQNPITAFGVQYMLAGVYKGHLEELSMESLAVDIVGAKILGSIAKTRPNFRAEHGALISENVVKDNSHDDYNIKAKVFDQIREHLVQKKLRMLDLFKIWDKTEGGQGGQITFEQMKSGLAQANIPITTAMLERMFRKLDIDNSGTITYNEFALVSRLK